MIVQNFMHRISIPIFIGTIAFSAAILHIVSCTPARIEGGPVSATQLSDGIYRGSATDGPVLVNVDVTIKQQRISHIELVSHRNMLGVAAEAPVPQRIIRQQSTRVDAVSGATASSRAIMNAVEDAVRKARTGYNKQ